MKAFALLAGLPVVLCAAGALAADAKHPQASFHSMINQGFAVVSTDYLPQGSGTYTQPMIIATLQRGTEVAVCEFNAQGWIAMDDANMEEPKSCDYRDYSDPTPLTVAAAPQPAPAPAPAPTGAPAPAQ
jgi:hypothetical protein